MLDEDLAKLYQIETKQINRAVNRNRDRFPEDFSFQLTNEEFTNLRYQIGTTNKYWSKKRYLPNVFTEHGVTALAGVLKSKKAIKVNLIIIRAFVSMKKFLSQNANISQKFQQIDQKLIEHDSKLDKVFEAIESEQIKPKQGIFFEGQIILKELEISVF